MSSMHDFRNIKFFRLFIIISLIILFISLFQMGAIAGGTPLTIQNFNYGVWGSYYITSYGSEMYFAGYVGGGLITRDIFTYNATSNSGQLYRVLINDNIQRTINVNDTFTLNEGYILKIKDFNMGAGSAQIWLSLLKDGKEVFNSVTNKGETFIYAPSRTGNVNNLPIIEIHVSNINNVSKTVIIDGVFQISETFITVTSPSDMPMKITSWGNNKTNDQNLNINVSQGYMVNFNVTTNTLINTHGQNCGTSTFVTAYFTGMNSTLICKFDTIGTTSVYIIVEKSGTTDTKTWTVNVLPANPPILTQTPTPTPAITSTQTVTPTPTITSTIQIQEIKQRAQLQVTYEVGSLINDRVTIKVFLKNIGDATATNINLTIEHSHELEPIAASGSKQIGDTISWTGELLPNTEHITEYSVKAIKGKDVEIPLKVTYAKISREEKAKALGISPSASAASINQEDVDTIIMIIKILKTISGFELIMAISILFLVYVSFKKNE